MFVRTAPARLIPAVLSLAVLMIPGCGGGGSSSTPTSPTAPSSPSTPVTGNACGATITGLLTTPQTIVNGVDCTAQTASSSVVWLQVLVGGLLDHFCSGTVIDSDSQWVLTAAHCLDATVSGVRVYPNGSVAVLSTEFHTALYTGPGDGSPDVGVVKFAQPLGRTPTPLLLSRDATKGEPAVIAGYGEGGAGVSIGTLRAAFVNVSDVTSSYVVVTAPTPTSSTICVGDSGGPLLISEGGKYAVAGITSSATAYCVNGTSYFARVNNSSISSFILSYVPNAAALSR